METFDGIERRVRHHFQAATVEKDEAKELKMLKFIVEINFQESVLNSIASCVISFSKLKKAD